MSSGSWPNFNAWLQTAWGAGGEYWAACGIPNATNLVFGQNPPWALDDLQSIYPKFFGAPSTYANAAATSGSSTIQLSNTTGLRTGQFLQSSVTPNGTIITAVYGDHITINTTATTTSTNVPLIVYLAPVVPVSVLQLYINLASASLVAARWQEQWYIAMALFVAHYATLYARSDALEVIQVVQNVLHGEVPAGSGATFTISALPPGGTLQALTKNGLFLTPDGVDYTLSGQIITLNVPLSGSDALYATWLTTTTVDTTVMPDAAKVAAQGIANGIQTSKSVGDVSASYQVLTSLEAWGQWNLTLYGQQLATMARVIGSGPMVIW